MELYDRPAAAIFFYDFTHKVETAFLESKIDKQKLNKKALKKTQLTISHEFRTPLASVLMIIEGMF